MTDFCGFGMVGAYDFCLAAFNLIIHNIFGGILLLCESCGIIYAPYIQKFACVHESIGDTIHSFFLLPLFSIINKLRLDTFFKKS